MSKSIWHALFFVLTVLIASLLAWDWFSAFETRSFVDILTPQNLDSFVEVYDQFIVTQRVRIERPVQLSGLSLPLFIRKAEGEITIRIWHDGKTIAEFTKNMAQLRTGETVIEPKFAEPVNVDREVEVEVSSTAASSENAPLLYVEKADDAYLYGNYRIADNEKKGDVDMKLFERISRVDLLREKFAASPIDVMSKSLKWILLVVIIGLIPALISFQKDR